MGIPKMKQTPLGVKLTLRNIRKNKLGEVHLLDFLATILKMHETLGETPKVIILNGKSFSCKFTEYTDFTNFVNGKIQAEGLWSRLVCYHKPGQLVVSFIREHRDNKEQAKG